MLAVSEQTAFGGDYNVFNTGALVSIVNNDDFHCAGGTAPLGGVTRGCGHRFANGPDASKRCSGLLIRMGDHGRHVFGEAHPAANAVLNQSCILHWPRLIEISAVNDYWITQ